MRKTFVNPMTGAVETVVEEGEAGGRRWAVLECFPPNFGAICLEDNYSPGFSRGLSAEPRLPSKVLRVDCSDFCVTSYASLLIADWKGFYKELAEMKSSDGYAYNPNFGISFIGMWNGKPNEDGEMYAEYALKKSDQGPFCRSATEFIKALSPILLRMAAAGPLKTLTEDS